MRAVACTLITHPASSLGSRTPEVAAVESAAEDAVEVLVHNDAAEKEVAVRDFNPPSSTRQEVWLTISQVNDV